MAIKHLNMAHVELRYAVNIKYALNFKDLVWKNNIEYLICNFLYWSHVEIIILMCCVKIHY